MRSLLLVAGLCAACSFDGPPDPGLITPDGQVDAPIDGSPDVDSDDDGIDDATDNCRGTPNPLQRDWDDDHVGDDCDHCPHLPDPVDPDGDEDGVGDACDPRPQSPGDAILRFNGFYTQDEIDGWMLSNGDFAVVEQAVRHSDAANTHAVIWPLDIYSNAFVMTQIRVTDNPGGRSGIGICSGTMLTSQYYCCEVRESSGNPVVTGFGHWGTTDSNGPPATWAGDILNGDRYELTVDLPGATSCRVRKDGVEANSIAPDLGPSVEGTVDVYLDSIGAEIEYLFIARIGSG